MSVDWQPPPWAMGHGRTFKITASAVAGRNGPWACPAKIALGARQSQGSIQPNDANRWQRTWDDASRLYFALTDGLWAMDSGATISEAAGADARLTDAQRRFVRHALGELAELPGLAADSAGVPMALSFSADYTGDFGRIYVSGPQYASDDGTVREAVRLRFKGLKGADAEEAQDFVATAAFVLAKSGELVERIRVSEFSLHTGDYAVLFEGTRRQATDLYAQRGRPVQEAIAAVELRPGSACADCAFLNVCPGPLHLRGALGIPARAVATRAISGTDLHAYDYCPTKFHAQRRDHLPDFYGEQGPAEAGGEAQLRGTATHIWLRWAHERTPPRGCIASDLPDPDVDWATTALMLGDVGLTEHAYRLARTYLLSHLDVANCLLQYDGVTDFRCEPLHVVHDPDSDTVIVAEPDLTAVIGPTARMWRETKTTKNPLPDDEIAAMHRYPAFALNIALLAAGVDGNARDDGAAELEILTPAAVRLYVAPLSDGQLVSEAQRLVAEIAHPWSRDLRFERRPSSSCVNCAVYGWCDPPASLVAPQLDSDDREFLGLPDPF
jgi:PD-(D/E)XK nuclease superfamily